MSPPRRPGAVRLVTVARGGPRFPDFLLVGAPKCGTSALHAALARAPAAVPVRAEGAEVLPHRRAARRRPVAAPGTCRPGASTSGAATSTRRCSPPPRSARGAASRPCSTCTTATPSAGSARSCRTRGWSRCCATPSSGRTRTGRTCAGRGWSPRRTSSTALDREPERIAAGWAHFWHYAAQGRYGEQLEHLFTLFPREQVLLIRYRELRDEPVDDRGPGVPLPRRRHRA